jgi:hypothetical protein
VPLRLQTWQKIDDHRSGATRWVCVNTVRLDTTIPGSPINKLSSIVCYVEDDGSIFLRISKQIYMVKLKTMQVKTI